MAAGRIQTALTRSPFGRQDMLVLGACLLLAAWAERSALVAFFSSPDDLFHLQQALGLSPTLPSPFRFLSQVLYFRIMVGFFGPDPIPFHLASLLVHLLNAALIFAFARLAGASRAVAGLCTSLFGSFPLFFPVLASAVGMNDELALALALAAMLLMRRPGNMAVLLACASFAAGLMSKESVVAMPLVLVAVGPPHMTRFVRGLPLLVTSAVAAGLLFLLSPQGPGAYTIGLGANVFHNLMTYTAWAVNLIRPMPDLVSSFDPSAWKAAIWVYAALLASWMLLRRDRPLIGIGIAWWLAGLLPVLLLRYQTYRHYLYPALPGLALAVAAITVGFLSRIVRSDSVTLAHNQWSRRLQTAILIVCALGYAIRANHLISARVRPRIAGTQLAVDPFIRKQEVAYRALASFAQFLTPGDSVKVAVFAPGGIGKVFGARTGREYRQQSARRPSYDLLEVSLVGGTAVRIFFPYVDTVAFISRWTPQHAPYQLFLPYQDGHLYGVGTGPAAHVSAARWMVEQGWHAQTRAYLDTVLTVYPADSALRSVYASLPADSDRR